ncbi:hypothetical protein BJ912DRAFT_950426 [Pholiota molesta]|nr:hypothetical protein BJ912DRAFT_950426 [Pholiota molesta]
MAQAGPVPISYIRSSRGPIRLAPHAESPLTSLRGGEARVIREEDEEADWRADAYSAYDDGVDEDEDADAESAYDYNYTGTPRQSGAFQEADSARSSYASAYSEQAGPSHSNSHAYITATTNNNTDASLRPPPPPQRLLSNLRIDVPGNDSGLRALHSPLLHGDFSRDSLATASESEWDDTRSSTISGAARSPTDASKEARRLEFPFQGADPTSPAPSGYSGYSEYGYEENEYASNRAQGAALRDSWTSTATGSTVRRPDYYMPPGGMQDALGQLGGGAEGEGAGRTGAVVRPLTNFSRPVRESGVGSAAVGERVTPQLPADMHAQKQKVLERNAGRVEGNGSLHPSAAQTRGVDGRIRITSTLLGIQHHEANRLGESARCFERSAKEDGGCGVGMLMYGLALRHGWGCVKNEKMAFRWLMRAAECAVVDLERLRRAGGDGEAGVVETELVLAIYEVGQCFFHGWGVAKDQKMAVSYYAVAAKLGDGDAQADLGYCLANGKGCKKDKRSAAQWYRRAVGQGQSDLGLGWIYKDKYQ